MSAFKNVHGWAYPEADDFMWREAKPDGSYQASHLAIAMQFVKDRRTAIDAGAHVGTWSKLMSGLFDRVIAVEPAVDTFECLQQNVRRFNLKNVDAVNVALGATAGYVSMALDGKPLAMNNTGGRYVRKGGTIRLETIDEWNLPSLSFLKMDIEGSEPDCILGASLTLSRCKPVVLWEDKSFCTRYGHDKDAPRHLLTSLGYRQLSRVSADEIWGPQ